MKFYIFQNKISQHNNLKVEIDLEVKHDTLSDKLYNILSDKIDIKDMIG